MRRCNKLCNSALIVLWYYRCMDMVFDWNLGNKIHRGLNTLRLCGFPFVEIEIVLRVSWRVDSLVSRHRRVTQNSWDSEIVAGWCPWFFPFALEGFSTLNRVSPLWLISFYFAVIDFVLLHIPYVVYNTYGLSLISIVGGTACKSQIPSNWHIYQLPAINAVHNALEISLCSTREALKSI
jgi:hypothetical protein